MKTRTYKIDGAKSYPAEMIGKELQFPVCESVADAESRTKDEASLVEMFKRGYDLYLLTVIRDVFENGGSIDDAQKAVDADVYDVNAPSTRKSGSAENAAARKERDAVNAAAANDPALKAKLIAIYGEERAKSLGLL